MGRWEVQYKEVGYHTYDIVYYDKWIIHIFDDYTYYSSKEDDEIAQRGYWSYYSPFMELRMGDNAFVVEKRGNKEIALYSTENTYVLKKVYRK